MSAVDPHAPILVGLGEIVRRPGDPGDRDPGVLMEQAVRAAIADAGAGDALLGGVAIGVAPSAAWPDGDPGRRVAELLGIEAPTLRTSMQGGNGPQVLVSVLGARIQSGALDAAVVVGAEALSTLSGLLRRGEAAPWPAADPDRRADEILEEDLPPATKAEIAAGMIAPVMAYPLIEESIRRAAGRTPAEQLERIAGLWSRFSAVAARQPAAWTQRAYDQQALATVTPQNRRVTLSYPKLLNSHIQVDQSAAVILCSVTRARELGIPEERWVYLHAGARATDEWFLSHRRELHRSPAIRACGQAALAHAGASIDELGPIDLYSCFPSAVQLAATELGLPLDDPDRSLTETGGLTFFGGPGNNYATHGIIAVARRLREAPAGTLGMSTALGWYATKHAIGIYGNAAPARPFADLEPALEPVEPREVVEPAEREATAETGTVIFHHDGTPAYGIVFALLSDGRRAVARTDDPQVLAAMFDDQLLGTRVQLHADGSVSR